MKLSELPINKIKGINDILEAKLSSENIYSVLDVLEQVPSKYEKFNFMSIKEVQNELTMTFRAKIVTNPLTKFIRRNFNVMDFRVESEGVELDILIYNRAFMKKSIIPGKVVYVTGKYDHNKSVFSASKLSFEGVGGMKTIKPIYSMKNVADFEFKKIVHSAYIDYFKFIPDDLPSDLVEKYKLVSKRQSLKIAHSPASDKEFQLLERRMKYEELFKFQLKLQYLKIIQKRNTGIIKKIEENVINKFISTLSFELTRCQKKAIDDILIDLSSTRKMNRLLQGDVGSGKTIVAFISILAVVKSGFQVGMMAPTELLAEQHYRKINEIFKGLGFNIVLLKGDLKVKERRDILENLKNNKIDIIIGTHALISKDVKYANLGLVITDEQHRFGVNQRNLLKQKGDKLDILFMTATPIPRTLAISLFGDMDVSTISEMPKGRKEIKTSFVLDKKIKTVYKKINDHITNKQQVYIVVPLVEESDKLELKNTQEIYESICNEFHDASIEILHGKMKSIEKDKIMNKFLKGEIDILISTTVIEVGVDVSNASLMIIMDAHRFGLAQLHQLRGRVGRSELDSECVIMSSNKTERLTILEKTSNGFDISEEDLKLRGPGDFFGNKQSGIPEFKFANVIDDFKILELARNDASNLVYDEKFYKDETYLNLRVFLKKNVLDKQLN